MEGATLVRTPGHPGRERRAIIGVLMAAALLCLVGVVVILTLPSTVSVPPGLSYDCGSVLSKQEPDLGSPRGRAPDDKALVMALLMGDVRIADECNDAHAQRQWIATGLGAVGFVLAAGAAVVALRPRQDSNLRPWD